jgi:uncharacterized protein (UPF0147 family)
MAINKVKFQENLDEIIQALNTLKEDEALPKNVKAKIDNITLVLNEDSEISSRVGQSLHILDEIAEDLNIPPFIRTQIWNISSMFEKLNH